jgi:aromatic ring-cleaving dioxygenase
MDTASNADAVFNTEMARRFRTAAALLRAQHAEHRRITAYERGAEYLEQLTESAASIYRRHGLAGLIALPTIGRALASAIADVIEFGHWRWLERLEGDGDPERILASIPTVGPSLAHRLHTELHIDTLDELERAVYDGRLGRMRGVGDKRWHAIRDALLVRRRSREVPTGALGADDHAAHACAPTTGVLLNIDAEYRTKADLNQLPTIAPRRFNPTRAHWLPVLHTEREGRHFTAMFSNTARAHQFGHIDDWVVISADGADDMSWTVVTDPNTGHAGQRVVRGETAPEHFVADGCLSLEAQ